MQSACEMPYFEGDFWPNVIEESIKELDQEEEEKRKREEAEAALAEAEVKEDPEVIGEGPEVMASCALCVFFFFVFLWIFNGFLDVGFATGH